jgi:hypothetical protein
MANTCIEYTVAGLTMNDGAADTLITEEIDGLDSVPLRRTKPPQGQGDGAILLTAKKQFRIVTFRGFIGIQSVEWNPADFGAAYMAVQDALVASWVSAIEALENASGTLAWAAHSLTVYKDGGFTTSGPEFGKKFILSLYAPNPTIA